MPRLQRCLLALIAAAIGCGDPRATGSDRRGEPSSGGPTPTSTTSGAPNPSSCVRGDVNVAQAQSDSGFSWRVSQAFNTPTDSNAAPINSVLKLFEDDRELGPAHTLHANIRSQGAGRFSHWTSVASGFEDLYFSASDNTNPMVNGRRYTFGFCVNPAETLSPPLR